MKLFLAAAALLMPISVSATTLPDSINYTIFSSGVKTGAAAIRVVERAPKLIIESETQVMFATVTINISARTVADPFTFAVEKFAWERTRADIVDSGEVLMSEEGYEGWIEIEGKRETVGRSWSYEPYFILEDYVLEHEILIALAFVASGDILDSSGILFPAAKLSSPITIGFVSEVEIESGERAIICRRIDVSITGATPYKLFFSPEMNLPVYMVFPAVGTEVFLDEFYGDHPLSKWVRQDTEESSTEP